MKMTDKNEDNKKMKRAAIDLRGNFLNMKRQQEAQTYAVSIRLISARQIRVKCITLTI